MYTSVVNEQIEIFTMYKKKKKKFILGLHNLGNYIWEIKEIIIYFLILISIIFI